MILPLRCDCRDFKNKITREVSDKYKKKEYAVQLANRDKPLSEGKVVIGVAYFGWSVYSETGDLCTSLSCPVPAGDFTISYSQFLPTIAPPGSYTLTLKIQDGNKNELTCIKFDFSIGFFGSQVGLVEK
ncbi:putative phosphatidylglycerol/ phosphatidylinositol transfer protein [Tanacetum coccineum]|uniref:Phosphatidylglycerol/ phosphatidylinositol transfer protein n=1 Tax=Tanacetum coccineum TaxID=301880 RepID=A0ABQ4WBP1_9ASTR